MVETVEFIQIILKQKKCYHPLQCDQRVKMGCCRQGHHSFSDGNSHKKDHFTVNEHHDNNRAFLCQLLREFERK